MFVSPRFFRCTSEKGLILNAGEKFILLRRVFDKECVACLLARNEIGSFFPQYNSKYVICFNKMFGSKRFL